VCHRRCFVSSKSPTLTHARVRYLDQWDPSCGTHQISHRMPHALSVRLRSEGCVRLAQARLLAKRLGPLADGFPRSIMEAVKMHRVPAELEPDLMCAAGQNLSLTQ